MSKMSKHYFDGIRDHSHQNLILLKTEVALSNRTTNFANFKVELLYDKVGKAKFNLMKQSQTSPKSFINKDK
jgi:hypothetical protein